MFTIDELLDHVINVGAYGLSEEFRIIRNQLIESSFDAFKYFNNKIELKNR